MPESTELMTIHAAADRQYDALRALAGPIPGLLRRAIERDDRLAAVELARQLREIEKTSKCLRGMLIPSAVVAEDSAGTVEEWV